MQVISDIVVPVCMKWNRFTAHWETGSLHLTSVTSASWNLDSLDFWAC